MLVRHITVDVKDVPLAVLVSVLFVSLASPSLQVLGSHAQLTLSMCCSDVGAPKYKESNIERLLKWNV